jgi:hypothetical protein
MYARMGLSMAAIDALQDLGLDSLDALSDITEKDVPSIVKELCRNNILIWQASLKYLHALHYWLMRQVASSLITNP